MLDEEEFFSGGNWVLPATSRKDSFFYPPPVAEKLYYRSTGTDFVPGAALAKRYLYFTSISKKIHDLGQPKKKKKLITVAIEEHLRVCTCGQTGLHHYGLKALTSLEFRQSNCATLLADCVVHTPCEADLIA